MPLSARVSSQMFLVVRRRCSVAWTNESLVMVYLPVQSWYSMMNGALVPVESCLLTLSAVAIMMLLHLRSLRGSMPNSSMNPSQAMFMIASSQFLPPRKWSPLLAMTLVFPFSNEMMLTSNVPPPRS